MHTESNIVCKLNKPYARDGCTFVFVRVYVCVRTITQGPSGATWFPASVLITQPW